MLKWFIDVSINELEQWSHASINYFSLHVIALQKLNYISQTRDLSKSMIIKDITYWKENIRPFSLKFGLQQDLIMVLSMVPSIVTSMTMLLGKVLFGALVRFLKITIGGKATTSY